jgi:uncharacterized membrane protein YeaQ/YmgE (transglycosylase-associated protein family)
MSFTSFIWTILIGLALGALARFIMPKGELGGVIYTMVLGFAGAFFVGILGFSLGWYREGTALGFLASLAGAVIVLLLYRVRASRQTA